MALDDLKPLIEQGNQKIADIRSEVDGIKSQDVLTKEKLARMESDLAVTLAAKQAADLAQKALETRLAEIETKANRPHNGGTGGEKQGSEYKDALIAFIRNPSDPSLQQKAYDLGKKAADVRTSTGSSGGFALPEEIAREIAVQALDISPIRSIARVVQVGTSDYKELVDLNGFGFEWVGEAGTRSKTDTPNIGEVAPTFGTIAAKPEATIESLDDLFFPVESWLIGSASRQFGVAEGAAFVSGNGTNKPTGFLAGTPVATADASRDFGVLQYIATGQAAALATNPFDTFKDLEMNLKAGYRANASYVMNSLTMAALAKVKDSTGQYLLQPSVADGVRYQISGFGVVLAEDMPNIAANALPVAFGDFSQGYLIADRVGMRIVKDEVTKAGYLTYQVFKRVGGKVKDSNAIKLLKIAAS